MVAVLASCTPVPGASTLPTSSTGESAADACSTFDIRSPAGEIVDLTGTWSSDHNLLYYAFQTGDCLWITGGFETSTTEDIWRFGGLGPWTTSFRGRLTAQFTVVGDWADVRTADLVSFNRGWGAATYEILFPEAGSSDGIVLQAIAFTGHLKDDRLTFLSPTDIPPP
jgi:hypothetical protein